jgi:hypothetical protein
VITGKDSFKNISSYGNEDYQSYSVELLVADVRKFWVC